MNVLVLDYNSTFDKVVHECSIRNAYFAGTSRQALIHLNARLKNRIAFIEWEKALIGSIYDTFGVQQGGINSDKIYKLCNNVQLTTAQKSVLGVYIGGVLVISSI